MSAVSLFLAFPDKALHYACNTCDQRCCKAGNLDVFPGELAALVGRHPGLELVGEPQPQGISTFATPKSGCWFLSSQGTCSLLTEAPAARPAACHLFPFNLFGFLGQTLVIAPHPLCPLQVVPGAGVSYEQILDGLEAHGAAGGPAEALGKGWPAKAESLEQWIRDAANKSLADASPVPLLACSLRAMESFLRYGEISIAGESQAQQKISTWLEQACSVWGIAMPDAQAWRAITPMFNAWASPLRLFAMGHVPYPDLPLGMSIAALYAAHWQSLRIERSLTPRALSQLVSASRDLFTIMQAWQSPWQGADAPDLGLLSGKRLADSVPHMLPEAALERQAMLLKLSEALHASA